MKKERKRGLQLATVSQFASVGFSLGAEVIASEAEGKCLQEILPTPLSPRWVGNHG